MESQFVDEGFVRTDQITDLWSFLQTEMEGPECVGQPPLPHPQSVLAPPIIQYSIYFGKTPCNLSNLRKCTLKSSRLWNCTINSQYLNMCPLHSATIMTLSTLASSWLTAVVTMYTRGDWLHKELLLIDWSEGWLVALVVFHILLTTVTVMTRNHHTTQAVLFFLLLLTVRSSETINQYAAKNWQSFSRQQYFDSQGLFISVVFSMPVLFNCMMMVMNWLWLSSSMMVTWKKAELEARAARQGSSYREKPSQSVKSSAEAKKNK